MFYQKWESCSYEVKWWVKPLGIPHGMRNTVRWLWGSIRKGIVFLEHEASGKEQSTFQTLSGSCGRSTPNQLPPFDEWEEPERAGGAVGGFPSVSLLQCAWIKTSKTLLPTGVQYQGGTWVCHMLLKGNMKWNINDFQRLESKQSGCEHCFWSSMVHILAWLVTNCVTTPCLLYLSDSLCPK